jgi:2-aminoadipate transaminase
MRHAILGAGGIGGLIAAALARAAADVTVLLRPESLATYPGELAVESAVLGDFSVAVPAADRLDREVDVLWVATKATQLDAALELAPPVRVGGAAVIPLLNGIDHVAALRARYEHVIAGTIRVESERQPGWRIVQPSPFLRIELAGGAPIAAELAAAGIPSVVVADETSMLWGKLAFLAPVALATTALGRPFGGVRDEPLFVGARTEALAVAAAEGADLDESARSTSAPDGLRSSMQKDVEAGRPPELDAIAGPILRGAERHGIAAPCTAELAGRVRWPTRFARRTRGQGGADLAAILATASPGPGVITFSGGFPDPATFPVDILGPIAERLVRDDPGVAMQYAASEGIASVRDYLCDRVAGTDGRRPDLGELIVTSGGIDCTELLAKSLLDPGDRVVVESPTYLGAIMGFRSYEADVHDVPMDADGMQVDVLAGWFAEGLRPKIVYTIPDHQNPTGRTMPLERRHALVDLCRHYGVCILEDVAYRELGYDGTWLPSLWSIGPDTVVQAGTFSKLLFPGLRLGWACGPSPLIAQLAVAKQNADQCSAALGQRMLEEYGRGGNFDTQLPHARAFYERRCRLLLEALGARLPDGCSFTRPGGGFFTWLKLPDGVDVQALHAAAAAERVAYVPGRPFYPRDETTSTVRLSFSRTPDQLIDEGVARLVRAIETASTR